MRKKPIPLYTCHILSGGDRTGLGCVTVQLCIHFRSFCCKGGIVLHTQNANLIGFVRYVRFANFEPLETLLQKSLKGYRINIGKYYRNFSCERCDFLLDLIKNKYLRNVAGDAANTDFEMDRGSPSGSFRSVSFVFLISYLGEYTRRLKVYNDVLWPRRNVPWSLPPKVSVFSLSAPLFAYLNF